MSSLYAMCLERQSLSCPPLGSQLDVCKLLVASWLPRPACSRGGTGRALVWALSLDRLSSTEAARLASASPGSSKVPILELQRRCCSRAATDVACCWLRVTSRCKHSCDEEMESYAHKEGSALRNELSPKCTYARVRAQEITLVCGPSGAASDA